MSPQSSFLRFTYTLFLGVLLATFIGVGIAAFYPGPKSPEYPPTLSYPVTKPDDATTSATLRTEQEKFNQIQQAYQVEFQLYNRNVSIIALVFSILILVISLTWFKKILLIADGLLLGSVLDLLYSIVRGFSTNDNLFRFLVVSVGLVIALVLGYVKFIAPAQSLTSKH